VSRIDSPPFIEGVAIIGMAGRFPGASSVAEFWRNQLEGVEAISHFQVEELEIPGAQELSARPGYVRSRSILKDVDLFDAEFFGIYPREAELMDPQHRLFLECCWQALEDAGYDPFSYPGSIGVHAGCSMPTYFLSRLCTNEDFIQKFTGGYQVSNYLEMLGNSLDFLSTRVSYKLNLRGPSFTLQAGCSTSLVAVCQAFQSLLTYQSDMALAGGSSITLPQKRGSEYQEGGMTSPDGHCRTFDANAQGTVFGSGVGVVLLKRMEDALRDGDHIYAVIRGCALNNDGASKVGFTAPSIEGQSRVIAMAQEASGVSPETVGYIEAHGTGTPMGDPIELAALTQAFRAKTGAKQFCAIGTAKTNVGHLDVAAGVTGLINATNILRHGILPPTLHFEKPNPKFDLENSPFYVNTKKRAWKPQELPRRAGVSAFGVGGTNAHVILEEPPLRKLEGSTRPAQLLLLSARSEQALERATDNLVEQLKAQPELCLPDVAWTLQVGRRKFAHRRAAVVTTVPEAIEALLKRDRKRVHTRSNVDDGAPVYFLFPGQGSQHPNMGRQVYESEPVFRQAMDRCCEILRPDLGEDLLGLLYPPSDTSESQERRITDTLIAQPAIFAIEYALAQLWMSWGIRPQGMLGHSVGEFVAACLAGVFSLEDALALVAARGRMMQQIPPGGMLSVRLPETEVRARLNGHLAIAAVNAPHLCVVAGPFEALDSLEAQLKNEGVPTRRLVTSHAFHSPMMDPVVDQFSSCVRRIHLRAPQIPVVSSVSGTWISESQATDPAYWGRHLRAPVQFSRGVQELLGNTRAVLLEVGPGNVLSTLARQHVTKPKDDALNGSQTSVTIVSSFGDSSSGANSSVDLLSALGAVWAAGLKPQWEALHSGEHRRRVPLPTYPFERKRFWLEASASQTRVPSEPQLPVTQTAHETRPDQETQQVTQYSESPTRDPQTAGDRTAVVSNTLAEIFADLSGARIDPSDASSTFLEMGFDSLFLTQVTQALHSKFGLKITFRQLLGDQSSLRSLTEFIDSQLPAEAFAPKESPAPGEIRTQAPVSSKSPEAPPLTTEASGSASDIGKTLDSALERLMHEQMQTMNQLFAQQLEALKGVPVTSSVAPKTRNELLAPAAPAVPNASASAPTPVPQEPREFKPFGPYKPPQKGSSGQLTERQQQHVRDLIERCTKRTPKSKSMTQQHRSRLADPRVVSGFRAQWKEMVYPILTVRSKGSRLWDVDGNEYIDILNGFGPIMLGHRPDFVERAIEKQLREGFEIGPQTPLAGEVAEMFCDMTGNERMSFCNTGSEAVIAALRVARTVTGRSKVVLFAGAYHGMFDEVLVRSVKGGETPRSLPIAPGIPRESVGNVVVLDYGTSESLEWIRAHAHELAAVLVEPVQSRHPHLQPREFLREIREITQNSGAALIFDEVVTGFRVDPGGCQALFDIRADLATYGKVLAGGMPIGVLAGKAQFMDALDGGAWQFGDDSYPSVGVTFFAGTFVRHPLTLAAVKAVLEHFREQGPQLQRQLTAKTASLVATLNSLFVKANVPSRIETFGSIFYFSFPADFPLGSLLYYHLREKGIYILEGFPCFLTTTHSEADVQTIIRVFDESLAEMQAGGALPEPAAEPAAVSVSVATAPEVEEVLQAHMTEPQREIFLAAKLGDDASCSFNESFNVYLRGALHVGALRDAVNALLARHDALRATADPDAFNLHFRPKLEIEIPLCDLSELEPAARESELRRISAKDSRTPFDLTKGPLVRAEIVRLEPDYHALLFTSHHMVCDGWSTNVLLDELAQVYSAKVRGHEPVLAAPLSFRKYAQAQLDQRGSSEAAEVESYWLTQFKDVPDLLDLPTDRPRPAVRGYAGATFRTHIDAETYRQIKQMGSKKGCTLFATLLAGFQTLLHRLSNQNDVVVGVPTAGQSLLEDGNLVGHCVNFLPLRTRFRDDLTFASLLCEVKKTLLDAYDHQSYTYGTLARKLAIPRDPSRLPLMEVQFNLERIGSNAAFAALKAVVDPNPKSAVNFDVFFNIVESDQGLMIDCDYNTGLFDHETIARWLNHYKTLLAAATHEPEALVDELPLMTAAETASLVAAWNPNLTRYAVTSTMHHLFEQQASHAPEAVAVVMGEQRITYRELNERANRLARALRAKGVRPDSLVAVCFERTIEMMVSLLAVLKAGGAYVPIDSSYPKERLAMMLEDAQAAIVLTQEQLVPTLPATSAEIICVDRDWPAISRQPATNPEPASRPENLAYMIYTSGSTGKPKGVMVTHANVVRLLEAAKPWFDFSHRDVWSLFHTYSFDVSVWEMWGCLLTGGRLVIAPYWISRSPQEFHTLLAKQQVTVLCQTPVAFYQLIEAEEAGAAALSDLRYVILAGEALNFANLRPWLKRHGDARPQIINMYGPTEATVYSTYRRLAAADIERETRSLIGVPLLDANIYILDANQRPVPPGVAGELCIAGAGVARGYLNRPELTAERFVPDPFVNQASARMYRSGDLARFLAQGDIDFLGRLDNQVKIHGFRIELGEIESILAGHPDIREVAVAARKDGPGDKKLVGYFVTRSGNKISGTELREFLQVKIPAHMIPYAYVQLEALPLNPSGKVDRAKLPAPDTRSAARTREYVPPRTPEEKILTDILSEVLRVENVGVTDNLFELGADSLHVFQITSRAAKAGLTITPRLLLQQRTIAGVVAEMGNSQASVPPPSPAIQRVARQKYRLTHETQHVETSG